MTQESSSLFCVRRASFTLLETLVVMMLLGVSVGVIGVNIWKSVEKGRFETSVQAAFQLLDEGYSAMMLGVDSKALFVNSQKEVKATLFYTGFKELTTYRTLAGVESVDFEGKANPELVFASFGELAPRGTLTLKGGGGMNASIYLLPQPSKTPPVAGSVINTFEIYPKELLDG